MLEIVQVNSEVWRLYTEIGETSPSRPHVILIFRHMPTLCAATVNPPAHRQARRVRLG